MSKNNANMKSLPADKTHRIGYLYEECYWRVLRLSV